MPFFPATARYSLPHRAIEMRRQRLLLAGGLSRAIAAPKHAPARAPKSAPDAVSPVSADFGAQGGDPSRGVDMDLSTCVNRYGPAPAAVAALREIAAEGGNSMVLHPYDAAERLVDVYRWATGVRGGAMIAGRGASEFIWAMGRELDTADVRVPLPAYTDYLKAFPCRGFSVAGEKLPSIEQVDAALGAGGVVIISNPHNPTGVFLPSTELAAVAGAHPDATLVVDESYVGFTPDPLGASALGCDVPNLVVLRSASKFYGIAAMRAGIAWCADHEPLKRLFGQRENWGLSGVDVHAVSAALRDFHWSSHSRAWMRADSAWLADTLSGIPGVELRRNANVHFQFAHCARAYDAAAVLARHGIGVRVLGMAHGVGPDALRIVAPRADERGRFAAVVSDLGAALS